MASLLEGRISTAFGQQNRIREIEGDEIKAEFLEHEFLSSYQLYYHLPNRRMRIKFIQQITNKNPEVVYDKVRWNSAGLYLTGDRLGPVVNDFQFEIRLRPEAFDAWNELGIDSVEMETHAPDGKVTILSKQNSPCYLPREEVISRRLREGYPPYRWLMELFQENNPLKIINRFFDGKIEIKFSSTVSYSADAFIYTYQVETGSPSPVHFQWLSTSSQRLEHPDGLIGTVLKEKPYRQESKLDGQAGPTIVVDVAVANGSGRLPKNLLDRLPGSNRLAARLAGGAPSSAKTYGIKDLPDLPSDSFIFVCPAATVAE